MRESVHDNWSPARVIHLSYTVFAFYKTRILFFIFYERSARARVCVRYFLPYRLRGIRRGNKKISPRTIRNNNSLVHSIMIL